MLVLDFVADPLEVVGGAAAGRQRVAREQGTRHRIDATRGDRAARKRRAHAADRRRRIVDDRHTPADGLGEDPLPLQGGRHRGNHRAADRLALALIVGKEERAVFPDRATEYGTELIAAVRRLHRIGGREDVARIERFVAQKLEAGAVHVIGARLRRQVDDATVEAAEFSRRTVRLDLEFLNGVDVREERHLPRLRLQHRDAVDEILVGAGTAAVDARQRRVRRQRHARHEPGQRDEVSAVQRQRRDRLVLYDLPEAGRGAAQQRGVTDHRDGVGHRAHRQCGIEPNRLTSRDLHVAPVERPEPCQLHPDVVCTRREPGHEVAPVRARRRDAHTVGGERRDDDGGS